MGRGGCRMAIRPINLTQSINPTNDDRANIATIPPESHTLYHPAHELRGMHTQNTGTCQSGGISPLYKKTNTSSQSIKTMDDSDRMIEIKDTWSQNYYQSTYPAAILPNSIVYNGTRFIAPGGNGAAAAVINHTTDFTAWTAAAAPEALTKLPWGTAWNGTKVVVIFLDSDHFWYADTGLAGSWSNATLPGNPTGGGGQPTLFVANTKFIVTNNASASHILYVSSDGINWTDYSANIANAYSWGGYIAGKYVLVRPGGYAYSSDAITWTEVTNAGFLAENTVFGAKAPIIASSGTYLAATCKGPSSKMWKTTDGVNWTQSGTTNASIDGTNNLYNDCGHALIYSNGYFYEIDGSNNIWISTDGFVSFVYFGTHNYGLSYTSGIDVGKNYIFICSKAATAIDVYTVDRTYKTILNNIQIGNNFNKYGLSNNYSNKIYSDLKIGASNIYGIQLRNGYAVVDILTSAFAYSSNSVSEIRDKSYDAFFLKTISPANATDYCYRTTDGKTNIVHSVLSGVCSISELYDSVYYLGTNAGSYYYLCVYERISNADGNTIQKAEIKTVNGSGSVTATSTKSGWFYSYNNGGTIGIVGIELTGGNYQFAHYTAGTGGFTSVATAGAGATIKYGINGQFAEYEAYQIYASASIPNYKSNTGKSGTGADAIDFLGYFSIIDYFTDNYSVPFYLRAVYNRALKSCDSLSISYGAGHVGRAIEVNDVDFIYRPTFQYYGSKIYVIYKTLSGHLSIQIYDFIENCSTKFTRISKNIFLLNTIDIWNLIDCDNYAMQPTGMDYNGAVWYDASTKRTFKIVNDFFQTQYNTETGINILASDFITAPYDQHLVLTYLTGNYYETTGAALATSKFNSEFYIREDLYSPIAIYAKIQNGFIFWDGEIYQQVTQSLMNLDLSEQISNILFPSADFFTLFGNYYLHDGSNIYLMDIENNTASIVARSDGIEFISYSAQYAFFFSYADNSIWTFNGGRSLQKYVQLNKIFDFTSTNLISGGYNNKQNVLIIAKGTTVFFIYDERMSAYTGTTGTALARDSGIYYITSTGIDAITPFNIDSASTAIRLIWQSAFFKSTTTISSLHEFLFYIKSAAKVTGNFTVNFYCYDEGNTFATDSETKAIVTTSYDDSGYAMLKYIPKYQRVLGFSIGIDTSLDVQIVDASVNMEMLSQVVGSPANTI